ncbi:MAG: hypothetical protein PHF62_00725 [Acholeplasmataceae bacterium]|nr:hypothetical protein [Acholeplasmataceae bacterium]MDD4203624.1 hypothetical protein [Acholeplasmataceae bacterium]MDD4468863.1 hypothetical protein [Acholeplasmataceae bacterium]MDD4824178.1 hypothetical protein [Acholeplasmataceae bacterium]
MSIKWINVNNNQLTVTLYDTNITLNKPASYYFESAYKVLVGMDVENRLVLIKHLNKEESLRGNIDKNNLLDLKIKPSYGRISSKKVISEIKTTFKLDFSEHQKFRAVWDTTSKMLKINLNEVI